MKKRIIILGSIVAAVVLVWTVAWFVLAGIVRQTVEAQALADGVASPKLTCATLDVGGFPFRFDVDCGSARIVSGDLAVDVPAVRASVLVYRPTHALAFAQGPIAIEDSFTGTRNSVAFSGLEASLRLEGWRVGRVSIVGKDVVWSDTLVGEALIAQSPLVEVHLLDMPEQHDAAQGLAALAGYARAETVSWPALTLTGANAEAELELTGLPDDVRNWGDAGLLQRLQQAGGGLRIVSIRGTDGDSTLDAQGNLALDPQGLVEGQITIASTGVAERIGPLLQEPWRTLVLGTPAPDGSHANQLNFRAGAVFSGLVPIASIPPLF